ncbi:hypothetical protein I317_02562 [Kwoniella heveanensis CBS 569]|nr:hypothetical protein I317_02562 [Kwoniella heveanensis CBS 569]
MYGVTYGKDLYLISGRKALATPTPSTLTTAYGHSLNHPIIEDDLYAVYESRQHSQLDKVYNNVPLESMTFHNVDDHCLPYVYTRLYRISFLRSDIDLSGLRGDDALMTLQVIHNKSRQRAKQILGLPRWRGDSSDQTFEIINAEILALSSPETSNQHLARSNSKRVENAVNDFLEKQWGRAPEGLMNFIVGDDEVTKNHS